MAKDRKAKGPSPPFNIDMRVQSFRVVINVTILEMNERNTMITYRRKRSGYHDIELIPNERIVGIVGPASGDAGGSKAILIEPQLQLEDVHRDFKLNGVVEATDTDFVKVTNTETGAISFVNPKHAIIKRPDDEANANVPKRGRRPKAKPPEEENVPDKASLLSKKKKKTKLKDKVRDRRERESDSSTKKRRRDW